MKKFISLILLLSFAQSATAQCSVVINTPTTNIECGDCFTLTAAGTSQISLLDADFNNSSLGSGWASNQIPMFTNPCGAPPSGTPTCWFGNQQTQPRYVETIDYDVTCGGNLCWIMKYAQQSGGGGSCEGPDQPNEGVKLQYSLNGGATWILIADHPPLNGGNDPYQTSWNTYCYTIPPAAQTTSTRFRWYQNAGSGAGFDHWGIDDVQVTATNCATYYYDWFEDGSVNSVDTFLCQNTSSEDYTVIYTNGIDDTCSATITMNASLSVDLGPDTILNCGQSSMDLIATESGGSGTYDYLWSTGATGTATQNGVGTGTYWVELTDANFPTCITSDTISVDAPNDPLADFDFTSVCEGFDITLTDISTPGDGPFVNQQWDFENDGIIDDNGASVITNYANDGTYQVKYIVEDNKGCIDSITKPVDIFDGPSASFTYDPVCSGYPTVFTNTTTPPAGSNNDTWLWNIIGQSVVFTNQDISHAFATPGVYDVFLEATSDDGCTGDTTIQVDIVQTPQADFTYFAPCEGEEVTFTNTSSGNYINSQWIFLNGTDTIRSQDAAYTFPPGSNHDVQLIIEDANENCSDTVTITVVETPGLTLNVTNQVDVTCNSGNDGIASLGVAQGTAPYSYTWTGSNSTAATADDLAFGTTTVTVTDINGCEITEDIIIDQPDALSITKMSQDTIICIGDSVRLYAQGTGGSSPYTFTWLSNNQVVAVGNDVHVTPSASTTTYTLVMSEACGSPQDTGYVTVNFPPEVDLGLSPDKTGECYPIEVEFTNTTNTADDVDYTIWTYSDGDIDTTGGLNSATHQFSLGIYDVDMEVVTDRGCRYFRSYNQLIEGYPYPEASFYVNPNPVTFYEPNVGAYSQSSNDIISYQWIADGAEPEFSSIQNPRFSYPNEIANYPLILVVENGYGCTDTLERLVRVENNVTIFAPNTFTPDGDGVNDTWRVQILGIDAQNFKLEIFNRWGETVFESLDPEGAWDGSYGGKIVKEGSYIWTIRAYDFENDNKHEFNGVVTILK